jgi:transposase-like protein
VPKNRAVSDRSLQQALCLYAGMVNLVLTDPGRWLGSDREPIASASLPARAFDAVRDRAFGDVTPASPQWAQQPLRRRTGWWANRIGIVLGLAAATPRFAGGLADRIPLQAALGASAAGLAVCAVAREHGVTAPADWVPLLARVLFDRDLASESEAMPAAQESQDQLAAAASDLREPPSQLAALGQSAQAAVRILWRLARIFFEVDNLLDERPRGGLFARTLAKLPIIGIAGGWLDERGGIHRAAREAEGLLASAGVR